MTTGPRGTDCPSPLHDHPLPSGYVAAANEADRRLHRRWRNPRCPHCGLYGWAPPAADLARSVPSETAQTEEPRDA